MKLAFSLFYILIAPTFCFSQLSEAELTASLNLFWNNTPDTIVKPFFRKYDNNSKQVIFFGTNHKIKSPEDSMFIQIEKEITNLNPTLILTEGYSLLLGNKQETTKNFGDIGFCAFTGFEKNIWVKSWDVPFNDMYYSLRKEFSANELYVLLVIVESSRLYPAPLLFADFINNYEARGWPFKPQQKELAYFTDQYRQYFNIPLQVAAGNKFSIPDQSIKEHPLVKKYINVLQQLRDRQLLKTLKKSLLENDRIFIQAGAFHLLSLEKIIPALLNGNNSNEPLDSTGTGKIILFGSNNNTIKNDRQYKMIKKEIINTKPDLILTQGFASISKSEKQTVAQSGVQGFCRLQGNNKSIRVNSWELPWNDAYYTLAKKYSPRDIYFSLLCWTVLNSNNINDLNTIEGQAANTLINFGIFGYPLVVNPDVEFNFLKEVADYLTLDSQQMSGAPVEEIKSILQKCINKDIINDWQTMSIAHLVKLTEVYKNIYNSIFIQANKEYIPFIKTFLPTSIAKTTRN